MSDEKHRPMMEVIVIGNTNPPPPRRMAPTDAALIADAPVMLELLRELGGQEYTRTYDGCPLCGQDGGATGKHGEEWSDDTGTIPCRIGALLDKHGRG